MSSKITSLNQFVQFSLFFLFLALSSFSQAQSDNIIAVPLKKVEGIGPFYSTIRIINDVKDCSNHIGIPDDLEESTCFQVSLNNDQALFDKFRNGEPLNKYEKMHFENGLDTTLLSKEKIAHSVTVFSGINKQKKIIIFDVNRNGDFSDDEKMEFDLDLASKDDKYWERSGTSFTLNYERFDPQSGQPIKQNVIAKIIPFSNGLDLSIDLLNFEHRVGQFAIEGQTGQIAMNTTNPFSGDFSNFEVFATALDEKNKAPKDYKNNGAYIEFKGKDFLIERASFFGDTLFLKRQKRPAPQLAIDKIIPFELEDLHGKIINSADYSDQHLLLNFWGTWCGPCKKKIPFLNQLHESAADKNLKIIGIAKEDDKENLKAFVEANKIDWKNIFEDRVDLSKTRLTELYSVTSYPTMFLFLPNGGGVMRANAPEEVKEMQTYLENLPIALKTKNLVPNHSFEQVKFINKDVMWRTSNGDRFNEMSVGWKTPKGSSPDYLDHKNRKKYFFYDYNVKLQNYRAIDGDKHVGISVYGCHRNSGACREYVQTQLSKPLEKGKKYYVEFWVSRIRNGATVNNLGAYFSNELLTEIHVELAGYTPQILKKEAIGAKPFKWEKISGEFTAEDDFKYVSIGNFFPDEKTKTFGHAATGLNIAYYFLDNINVEEANETADENPFDNVKIGETYVLKNLHFAFADSVVLEKSNTELNKLLAFLQKHPNTKIEIIGHTDNAGKDEFNVELSKKRSKAVSTFLIKRGIDFQRVITKGKGDLNPIASNQTEAGRQENRRVEVKLIE